MKTAEAMDLARNESSSPDMLDAVFGINVRIDQELAKHPNSSPDLLVKLASKKDESTRKFAIVHPNFPPDALICTPSIKPLYLTYSSAFSRMTQVQLAEMFAQVSRNNLTKLLKYDECPENVLLWVTQNGSDAERLLVSQRNVLPGSVRDQLLLCGGKIAAAASKPRALMINRRGCIVGDYGKTLKIDQMETTDLLVGDYELDELVKHQECRDQKPVTSVPDILIANNDVVESISLNIDSLHSNYVLLENLPKLKTLEVYGSLTNRLSTLNWLVCKNIASLEKISIRAHIKWLELDELPKIQALELNECRFLAHLGIRNTPALNTMKLHECLLLRDVFGLSPEQIKDLKIHSQIQSIQKKSKCDVKIRVNMTFTEIDSVLEVINQGLKAAVRKKLIDVTGGDGDLLCSGKENDLDFHPFSYRILQPLESVYTGGTGSVYFYEHRHHDFVNGKYGISSSIGCNDPQDCLEESLRQVIDIAGSPASTSGMLKLLSDALSNGSSATAASH